MKRANAKHDEGFTLIEVIVSLMVAAIFMALIVPYMGTALTKSGSPLAQLRTTLTVFRAMENMNTAYRALKDAGTLNLPSMRTVIGTAGTNRNNAFGTYRVVTNSFIRFNGAGQEIAAGANQDVLKVTIGATGSGGPFFTVLFTRDLP